MQSNLCGFIACLSLCLAVGPAIPLAVAQEGPANPPVYACVDTTLGVQTVHWQASQPCVAPLLATTQSGQPSLTIYTASFNSDGSLSAPSALSGNASFNQTNGVYTVTFKQPFPGTPGCNVALDAANAPSFQIEESQLSKSGILISIQSGPPSYTASSAPFVLSCTYSQ